MRQLLDLLSAPSRSSAASKAMQRGGSREIGIHGGGLVALFRIPRSRRVPQGPKFLGNSAAVHCSPRPALLHTHEVRGSSPLAPTT
jgi:hypothetical protein